MTLSSVNGANAFLPAPRWGDPRVRGCGTRFGNLRSWRLVILLWALVCGTVLDPGAACADDVPGGKLYEVVDGKADQRTYNGFRRYHASCNHCHGPDGMGSSFGPSLIDGPMDIAAFRRIVRFGRSTGISVMKGFGGDPNVALHIDDIYTYLQARTDGALGRGRPGKLER